jgi:hypothetical protein
MINTYKNIEILLIFDKEMSFFAKIFGGGEKKPE